MDYLALHSFAIIINIALAGVAYFLISPICQFIKREKEAGGRLPHT